MSMGPRRTALIEYIERDGRPGRTVDLWAWPVTLGRAIDNDVVIDDPHVAAQHAQLLADEAGHVTLLPLASHNGVQLDGHRVAGATAVPAGGAWLQMGSTRLRLRLAGEVLAPEMPLPAGARGGPGGLALMAAAMFALLFAQHWVSLDPGADFSAWLPALLGLPGALAGWCGVWALMSKLFQHRFDFMGHLRIALPWLLVMALAESLWPQAGAALAAPGLWRLNAPLQALLLVLLVHAHLRHVLPGHGRAVSLAVGGFAVAAAGLSLALTQRSTDSFSAAPYMSTLPPPALRLGGTVPPAVLLQDIAPLAAKLAQRARKAGDEGDSPADATE